MTLAGSLGSYRALENAAIALGDELPAVVRDRARDFFIQVGWEIGPALRYNLAELLDDVARALREELR